MGEVNAEVRSGRSQVWRGDGFTSIKPQGAAQPSRHGTLAPGGSEARKDLSGTVSALSPQT